MLIFHIVLPRDWDAFEGDEYSSASLAAEGFIHCSYAHQLDAVIERYYDGAESLVLLTVDTGQMGARLVEEPSTGGEVRLDNLRSKYWAAQQVAYRRP